MKHVCHCMFSASLSVLDRKHGANFCSRKRKVNAKPPLSLADSYLYFLSRRDAGEEQMWKA